MYIVSAKLTIVGGKMAPPPWGAPISQTCICLVIKFYAVSFSIPGRGS